MSEQSAKKIEVKDATKIFGSIVMTSFNIAMAGPEIPSKSKISSAVMETGIIIKTNARILWERAY